MIEMNKKVYMTPVSEVVELQMKTVLLTVSTDTPKINNDDPDETFSPV